MTLYTRILLIVLIPCIAVVFFDTYRIQKVINGYETVLDSSYIMKIHEVEKNLKNRLTVISSVTAIFSGSNEVSKALLAADNEVLFDLSRNLEGLVDNVLISDLNGIVVSRAPDEFRFGDNVSDNPYFSGAIKKGDFIGLCQLDSKLSIVRSKALRQYDDMPLGVVSMAITITPEFLSTLLNDNSAVLELISGGKSISSADLKDHGGDIVKSEPIGIPIAEVENEKSSLIMHFRKDSNIVELEKLRSTLYISSFFSIIILSVLIIISLQRHLKPYSIIVGNLVEYAELRCSADELHRKLSFLKAGSDQNAGNIAEALVKMLDTMKGSFEEIEAYNLKLNNTVAELEKSLEEVKTLSGLIPICCHCKKIRDDKGYWNLLEEYIQTHSEAKFSHGVCPACMEQYYSDILKNNK